MAAFANAKTFAASCGRSVAEIRQLCKLQIIPNEKSGRDYIIDTDAAMKVLKERAANFAGHKFEFKPKPVEPKVISIRKPKVAKKTGNNFLDMLNQLAKEAAQEAKRCNAKAVEG